MNSEEQQQLFGGEIADYHKKNYKPNGPSELTNNLESDQNIQKIYDTQVRGKRRVNTTGIIGTKSGMGPLGSTITRDPLSEKLEQSLQQSLRKIINPEVQPSLSPEQEAMNNIKKALEELKQSSTLS
jgi:hypothetical protein